MLRQDFAGLNPGATGEHLDWWQSLTVAMRSAVSRPGDTAPTPREAAAAALARGDIAAAANHLRRLPAPRSAALAAWLAAAERLQAGTAALTTLETAAIMPPAAPNPALKALEKPGPLSTGKEEP
jgi:hypothetical protein